jgi:hypothetical protein
LAFCHASPRVERASRSAFHVSSKDGF